MCSFSALFPVLRWIVFLLTIVSSFHPHISVAIAAVFGGVFIALYFVNENTHFYK